MGGGHRRSDPQDNERRCHVDEAGWEVNPGTTIKYELRQPSDVRLSVYDVLGREVSVIVNQKKDAGVYEVRFDGTDFASGVYLCRLQAGNDEQVKKLLLLR